MNCLIFVTISVVLQCNLISSEAAIYPNTDAPYLRDICEYGLAPCSTTSTMCIPRDKFCDGHVDCEDGLDEVGCIGGPSIARSAKPQESYAHNILYSRTVECNTGTFRCLDGTCIELRRVCDGKSDCSDSRDEEGCGQRATTIQSPYMYPFRQGSNYSYGYPSYSPPVTTPETVRVKIHTYDSVQTVNLGNDVVFRCRDESPLRVAVFWSRADNQQLPFNAHDSAGRLSITKVTKENEGTYICQANGHPDQQRAQLIIKKERKSSSSSEESNRINSYPSPPYTQAPASGSHYSWNRPSYTSTESTWPSYTHTVPTVTQSSLSVHSSARVASLRSSRKMRDCSSGYISCRDGSICIERSQVCDYRVNCPDGSDEEGCRKKCINHQFTCGSLCLDKNKRCDGRVDCLDSSDEFQCENECSLSSYWCPGSQDCIPQNYVCDGEYDCPNGADEKKCEKPKMIQQPEKAYSVEKGKSITLSCRASGYPKPVIEWRFNFQKVPAIPSSHISVCTSCHNCTENEALSSLTLANFDERLEGKWTCEAVNSVDTSLAPHDTDLALRPASSYVSGVY